MDEMWLRPVRQCSEVSLLRLVMVLAPRLVVNMISRSLAFLVIGLDILS